MSLAISQFYAGLLLMEGLIEEIQREEDFHSASR